jgi:hypothetical protein
MIIEGKIREEALYRLEQNTNISMDPLSIIIRTLQHKIYPLVLHIYSPINYIEGQPQMTQEQTDQTRGIFDILINIEKQYQPSNTIEEFVVKLNQARYTLEALQDNLIYYNTIINQITETSGIEN